MRRVFGFVNLLIGTAINMIYARHVIKRELERIAEKEEWRKPHEFVVIMFAKGKYNNSNGIKTALNDYKFAGTISGYSLKTATDRNVKFKK
jgi:hypothetical protein